MTYDKEVSGEHKLGDEGVTSEMTTPLGQIPREHELTQSAFAARYLIPSSPVVVSGAVKKWAAFQKWSLKYFARIFREVQVGLQDDYFGNLATMSLPDFIWLVSNYEVKSIDEFRIDRPVPFLRAFRNIPHERLRNDWSRPEFLPRRGYVRPISFWDSKPNRRIYPSFGVYLSPRGAATRLHVDARLDNAVLCQVRGRKCGILYDPSQKEQWAPLIQPTSDQTTSTRKAVEVLRGSLRATGRLRGLAFELDEGDALFIPKGWAHEVYTLNASISVTYNFLHASEFDLWERIRIAGNSVRFACTLFYLKLRMRPWPSPPYVDKSFWA